MDEDVFPPYYSNFVRDWINFFSSAEESIRFGEERNPYHLFELIVAHEPYWALELIFRVFEADKDCKTIGLLTSGPLQEFVRFHGHDYIDKICDYAVESSNFKQAMLELISVSPKGKYEQIGRRIAEVTR